MPHLRVVVGGNTIVVQREHGYIIAACSLHHIETLLVNPGPAAKLEDRV